ncbi:MAG: hypothetical protein WA705_10135 [Candidatus Ozemobacteraceae bacterium]
MNHIQDDQKTTARGLYDLARLCCDFGEGKVETDPAMPSGIPTPKGGKQSIFGWEVQAIGPLRRALQLDPELEDAARLLVQLLRSLKRTTEEIKVIRERLSRYYTSEEWWERLIATHEHAGKPSDALAACREGLSALPSSALLSRLLQRLESSEMKSPQR